MDNVQQHITCNSLPSSQTFRSYLHNQYGPGIYPNFRKFERLKIQLAKTSNHLTFLMKCKIHDIVPKGLLLKAPYHSHRSYKITLRASKALLRDRIQFHRFLLFLALTDGLCCTCFMNPFWNWHSRPEIGASSVYWTQLSRFYLKTGTDSSSRNVVFLNRNKTVF